MLLGQWMFKNNNTKYGLTNWRQEYWVIIIIIGVFWMTAILFYYSHSLEVKQLL